ncbi:unnamed protein product [Albugo candida]|uniref:Uncharacterized protein n=1 Tax=Albugo candida TaxID=65357 RepID=A0A024G3Q9_9STRA|nr:unnamed protein product [Albugo candida]|eukprot:CCI40929.1 unnamed protein product [Albugo candida]
MWCNTVRDVQMICSLLFVSRHPPCHKYLERVSAGLLLLPAFHFQAPFVFVYQSDPNRVCLNKVVVLLSFHKVCQVDDYSIGWAFLQVAARYNCSFSSILFLPLYQELSMLIHSLRPHRIAFDRKPQLSHWQV